MIRVLLLEDECALRTSVASFLKEDMGFDVEVFSDGEAAFDAIYERPYDLLLLDVKVPGKSGFELLKEARENGNKTPAIFMTSLTDIEALETGYQSGCCDYIRKPFDLSELKLRIQQAIRANCFRASETIVDLSHGYQYDLERFLLRREEKEVKLTRTESQVVALLVKNRGNVVTIAQFQDEIWGEYVNPANIRVQINNLRKKLADELILNVRGFGYKIG